MRATSNPSGLRRLFGGFAGKLARSPARDLVPAPQAPHCPSHPLMVDGAPPSREITRTVLAAGELSANVAVRGQTTIAAASAEYDAVAGTTTASKVRFPDSAATLGWTGSADEPAWFDAEGFERTAGFLSDETVIIYMGELAERSTALLHALTPTAPAMTHDLAAQAHKLAGSAGMFGFHPLSTAARRYERALETSADESAALADALKVTIAASLPEMRKRASA